MGDIFYFFGLILFLSNLNLISNFFTYIRIKQWFLSFKKITKKEPKNSDFKRGEQKIFNNMNGLFLSNFFWIFFGLLTNSWKIFTILLIISLIINLTCKLIGEFTLFSKVVQFLKLVLIAASISILTINHFHLHSDLFRLFFPFLTGYFPFNI
jgi:hypothetical protein